MAFRKHVVLASALLVLVALFVGCAEDTTSPAQQNEAPLYAPTNVQAVVIDGRDIQVSWNPSSQINVRGYNVYRLDVANSAIERLNSSVISGASFVDRAAAWSHEYEYRVTSVGTKNQESQYASTIITNRTPVPDRQGRNPDTKK